MPTVNINVNVPDELVQPAYQAGAVRALLSGPTVQGTSIAKVTLRVCCSPASTTRAVAMIGGGPDRARFRVPACRSLRYRGLQPADAVNAVAAQAMAELGVDMSEELPKPLTD